MSQSAGVAMVMFHDGDAPSTPTIPVVNSLAPASGTYSAPDNRVVYREIKIYNYVGSEVPVSQAESSRSGPRCLHNQC